MKRSALCDKPVCSNSRPVASLRSRIEANEFRPGEDPLPSEKDLVDLFGVARDTARRAIQLLRDEGLVETIPQRGSYVLPKGRRQQS